MRQWERCPGCGSNYSLEVPVPEVLPECAVCEFLGPKSCVKLMRDPTPERIAAFRAAPPGWLRVQRDTGNPVLPRAVEFKGDPRHE